MKRTDQRPSTSGPKKDQVHESMKTRIVYKLICKG